ncbi:MAG: hypothetical protein QOD60_2149 [Solirubrobacterales bacterium]|nr:hypothetical protein [Solirubrobacterales bacterium]
MQRQGRLAAAALGAVAVVLLLAIVVSQASAVGAHAASNQKGKAGPLVVSTKSFDLSVIDSVRYEVYCPRGTRPFGGGEFATPVVDDKGTGIFPDSSERLGAQQGWHITVTETAPASHHNVTLQAFCRKFKGNVQPVESELGFDVRPGETKSATATCPGNKKIISGGFLTTGFRGGKGTFPGMYVTQSRMTSPRSWTVTAVGEPGGTGGQFNPIAYCFKSKKPLLTEKASAPVTVQGGVTAGGATATAVAPSCGRGKHGLAVGGYSGDTGLQFFDTYLNGSGAWSVSAIPFSRGGTFTAYAYCYAGK